MNARPHGRKHTLALWMLVALADLLLIVTSPVALTVTLTIAVLAGATVLAVKLLRRQAPPSPVTQGVRSWQVARARTEGQSWWERRA